MGNEDIGSRLRKARESKRLSQKQVAEKIGIHHSTLGKYELGRREPDFQTIQELAEIYDVSPMWIMTGKEENKKNLTMVRENSTIYSQTFDEKLFNVLEAYRRLPDQKKKIVDDMIKALLDE